MPQAEPGTENLEIEIAVVVVALRTQTEVLLEADTQIGIGIEVEVQKEELVLDTRVETAIEDRRMGCQVAYYEYKKRKVLH